MAGAPGGALAGMRGQADVAGAVSLAIGGCPGTESSKDTLETSIPATPIPETRMKCIAAWPPHSRLPLAAPALAQTTMKISISVAQNSHQGVAIDTFAKEVEKRTNGKYKIQTFYSGSLGGERESIEAVQLGTQELTFTSTGPVPNFVPEAKILDIPSCSATRRTPRVLDGPIGQDMLKAFEPKGLGAGLGRERLAPHDQQQAPVNGPRTTSRA